MSKMTTDEIIAQLQSEAEATGFKFKPMDVSSYATQERPPSVNGQHYPQTLRVDAALQHHGLGERWQAPNKQWRLEGATADLKAFLKEARAYEAAAEDELAEIKRANTEAVQQHDARVGAAVGAAYAAVEPVLAPLLTEHNAASALKKIMGALVEGLEASIPRPATIYPSEGSPAYRAYMARGAVSSLPEAISAVSNELALRKKESAAKVAELKGLLEDMGVSL